jgi:fucose 4-O-acetylase-like acetyltransferase
MTLLLPRALEVWLLIAAAESLHGTLRTVFLAPAVGDFRARQIAVFTGSLLIFGIAYVFRNWIGAGSLGERLGVGALWVLLTLTFEVVLGRFVMGLSWERIASDYDVLRGGLMPLGLLAMLFAPVLAAWVAKSRRL